jgi:AhpD family alkylhydroperoxidase
MSDPRIRPGTRSEVGPINWAIGTIAGRVAGTNPPNLLLTMARHRRLFRGWLRFAARLMPGGSLPRRDTEMVILRVAHLRDSAYEFEQHRRLARRAGVSDDEIARVTRGPSDEAWSERARVMLEVTDELVGTRDVSEGTWSRLGRHLDERKSIELLLLVGHYDMLATFIRALRIEPDESPRSVAP